MATPQKPEGVPQQAYWWDDYWTLGTRDSAGKHQGLVRFWRENGTFLGTFQYADDEPHGPFERFHDAGDIAERGSFVVGELHGEHTFYRAQGETSESPFHPAVHPLVARIERRLERGVLEDATYYDAGDRVVDYDTGLPQDAGAVLEVREAAPRLASDVFRASVVADLAGYVENRLTDDVSKLFPSSPVTPVAGVTKQAQRLLARAAQAPPAVRAAVRALDRAWRAGTLQAAGLELGDAYGFDFAEHGLLADQELARHVGLAYDDGGNIFTLDLETGAVLLFDHETEALLPSWTFTSIDVLVYSLVRFSHAQLHGALESDMTDLLTRLGPGPTLLLGRLDLEG